MCYQSIHYLLITTTITMTLGYSRRISTLLIVAILALQLVLISDNLKPVKGDKKLLQKLKKIGALLFLLKSKKPKFGILPIPLPLPLPLKIEKPEHPVVVHKKHHTIPITHNIPVHEPYAEPYPVMEAPSYVDGGYSEGGYGGGGYGGGGHGGYGGGYGGEGSY